MGRSRKSKFKGLEKETREELINRNIPITNLPEKYLWMHVKNGSKIRNVLGYALKEFCNYNSVVWTGVGHGIGKTISCAELFKRKYEALHQVTKLCYTKSEKSQKDTSDEARDIPQIHILLTRDIKDTSEIGYQAPGDRGEFLDKKDAAVSKINFTAETASNAICIDDKFKAMGLRIRQKRQTQQRTSSSSKKHKKSDN